MEKSLKKAINNFKGAVNNYYSENLLNKLISFRQCPNSKKEKKLCLSINREKHLAYFKEYPVIATKKTFRHYYRFLVSLLWYFLVGLLIVSGLVVVHYKINFIWIAIILSIVAPFISISCSKIKGDIEALDKNKKAAPHVLTKIFSIPLLFSLGKRTLDIIKNDIILYLDGDKLIISRIFATCPVCASADKNSKLIIKNKCDSKTCSTVAECERGAHA